MVDQDSKSSATTATTWRYSTIAIVLHWLLAALILFLLGLGWWMMTIEKQPGSATYFDLHKSLGLIVLTLVVVRIAWRSTHQPEGLPDAVPVWQARASRALHWALYATMVVMPAVGYLGASFQKHRPEFFGLPTPAWAAPNHDVAERYFAVHSVAAWVLAVLVSLHVVAGLKHLLIDRDRVFQRMWFRRSGAGPRA